MFDCPLKKDCLKTAKEKRITVTYYREEYEQNNARVNSKRGSYMKKQRQSRVEPVFGVLTQYLGLRKINTKGLSQANKLMHMSAIAYNLKKYLKFINKTAKSNRKAIAAQFSLNISIMCFKIKTFKQLKSWCF